MKHFLKKKKQFLTTILSLTGIGIAVAYAFCLGACSYLKGDILGIDLKYLGIIFMILVLILALTKKPILSLLLLSFGTGGELFLIGYQVRVGVYCPYCLFFGLTLILAFIVNFERSKKWLAAMFMGAGLAFFLLFFSGSTAPAYAATPPPATTFGTGPVHVRIYTDYFCGPCRAEEPEVMALITELVEKGLIRVTFIDTPIHKETVLYAGYFLSALNAKGNGDLRQAIALRATLFEAAEQNIREKDALELFLKKKWVTLKPFDTAPVYKIYSAYLKEDGVNSTPTCVIVDSRGKQSLTGKEEILKGLRGLRK
jgi:uncharacterized membrane protein